MTMRDYKRLFIWQKGMDITREVCKVVSLLPDEDKYRLRSRAKRVAVSIVMNIAEGSAKTSRREYRSYAETSLGSVLELETVFRLIERLKLIDKNIIDGLMNELLCEQWMINSFITQLKSDE